VAGYNVYYGGASRIYTNVVDIGNSTHAMITGLLEGQPYFFAVTAYTVDGLESDYSEEIVYLVPGLLTITPGATPNSPMQIRFPAALGHWYELQLSTDLISWLTIWQVENVSSNNWVEYEPPINTSQPQFFRVILH